MVLLSCVGGVSASDGKSILRDIGMSGAGLKKHGLSGSGKSFLCCGLCISISVVFEDGEGA